MQNDKVPKNFIDELEEKLGARASKTEQKNQQTPLKCGDKAKDGSIYLGFFDDKDWFVTAGDAKDKKGNNILMDFNTAAQYAKNLKVHGHDDWQVPPAKNDPYNPDILHEMFNHKSTGAFKNTYAEAASLFSYTQLYWSSTSSNENPHRASYTSLAIGGATWFSKSAKFSVRCVRSIPRKI